MGAAEERSAEALAAEQDGDITGCPPGCPWAGDDLDPDVYGQATHHYHIAVRPDHGS